MLLKPTSTASISYLNQSIQHQFQVFNIITNTLGSLLTLHFTLYQFHGPNHHHEILNPSLSIGPRCTRISSRWQHILYVSDGDGVTNAAWYTGSLGQGVQCIPWADGNIEYTGISSDAEGFTCERQFSVSFYL